MLNVALKIQPKMMLASSALYNTAFHEYPPRALKKGTRASDRVVLLMMDDLQSVSTTNQRISSVVLPLSSPLKTPTSCWRFRALSSACVLLSIVTVTILISELHNKPQ
ncbi:hypothetical protein BCR42DRAFT_443539 [Absidia repens]|uniref:Uncharacterized protein n=1 Tax=Absidia repens TaxID=90262 RepID=A0A1X2HZA3_9FUNG|nr:hypothetical protein BCR42DRAFT_443539 [Absidia repens]